MFRKKIVLMNHTNMQGHHFGCARVMRFIESGLSGRGCAITARLDGKMNWQRNMGALAALSDCDAIVINGEGTLHHGRKKATWLMEVATHPATSGKELALINALYQENPDSWIPMIRRFRHLYARDARSAALMSAHAGRPVTYFGDLSMSEGSMPPLPSRNGILIGDSVRKSATERLCSLAAEVSREVKVNLIPLTVSLREENPFRPWLFRRIRGWSVARRQRLLMRRYPLLHYAASEGEFISRLRECALCVTGRFHGVCLNLVTGTPFIALSSNSWKIEALFEDAGLDRRRLVQPEQLTRDLLMKEDWEFSDAERKNVAAYLARSESGAREMFDALSC